MIWGRAGEVREAAHDDEAAGVGVHVGKERVDDGVHVGMDG